MYNTFNYYIARKLNIMVEKLIKVILVRFKATGHEDVFGSFTAIYDEYSSDDIGYTLRSLQGFRIDEDKPFENDKVVIKIFRLKQRKREQ